MQTDQRAPMVPFAPATFSQSLVRQMMLSASLSLAATSSVSVTSALAHNASPILTPVSTNPMTGHTPSSGWGNRSSSNGHTLTSIGTGRLVVPFAASSTLHPLAPTAALVQTPHTSSASSTPSFANQAPGASDIDLMSATALFSAGSLAGFHTITLDIGGKSQQIGFSTKLTGAELVAAQQVLSGGKQELSINATGIATGGIFDLNSKTIAQLDGAVGGSIGGLDISHGVVAVDTLSSLSLTGSLVNLGTINVGATSGSKGQTTDAISAANVFNASGAVISSASGVSGVTATGLSLSTPGVFYNSGTVSSSSSLNVSAVSITNSATSTGASSAGGKISVPQLSAADNINLSTSSLTNIGTISAGKGNVNIVNNSINSDLNVVGTGGTVQALNGNINFNASGYTGSDNINVSGGNWLSQQVNFNAGTGSINADVGQLTGVVNGTASSSHITADTGNLKLGAIDTTGDPTYYNTGGDISIGSGFADAPGADLAIIATGNIIGDGGTLVTAGGSLTIIAGANFTPTTGEGLPDMFNTPIVLSDSLVNPGKGSSTGGYIDLSGVTLTATATTGAAVLAVDTSSTTGAGGNVLMVAYAGLGSNSGTGPNYSGSIWAADVPNGSGASTINTVGASGFAAGNVTLIGGGNNSSSVIFAQNITGGVVTILGGTPTIQGGTQSITIINGTIQPGGGSYTTVSPTNLNEVLIVGNIIGSSLNIASGNSIFVEPTNPNNPTNGNIIAPGGVTITTPGFVEVGNVITAGAGGAANTAGQAGGNISISGASGVFVEGVVDASGGGGGGGNPGTAGGAGGNGGNVTLTASGSFGEPNLVSIDGYVNASGGGGGGGGGGGDFGTGNPGAGGAGGSAGKIAISSQNTFFAFSVYDYDGGAGAGGGLAVTGASGAGGGGGGGGGSAGGGGGGGAAGTISASATGTAVGGGGGGGLSSGGGGGGTTGSATATAGTGGSQFGTSGPTVGIGGTGTQPGASGNLDGFTGGAGGNSTSTTNNGAGGFFLVGGSGGQSSASMLENDGKNATTVASLGSVTLSVGAASGTAKEPIEIDTAALQVSEVAGTPKTASIFLVTGADALNLQSAALVTGTTLSIVDSLLLSPGGGVTSVSGTPGSINITGAVTATTVDLVSTGPLTTTGVGASISATTASLSAAGNLSVATAVNSLSAITTGASLSITEAPTSSNALTITKASVATGGTFTVTSEQQINITPAINVGVGSITLTATGSNSGIAASGLLSAADITLTANGAVGTSSKPMLTNVATLGTLTVNGSPAASIFIKDASTGTLTVDESPTDSGGTISIVSAAQTLNVNNLQYSNVTLNDTSKATGATVTLNQDNGATNQIGNGTGTVTVIAANASISQGTAVTLPVVDASKAVLTSAGGDVAGTLADLLVTASNLTVSAAKGLVAVNDTSAATLNAGSSLNGYTVTTAGLIVAGAISGPSIALSAGTGSVVLNANVGTSKSGTVSITAGAGITQNTKALISGVGVDLINSGGNIGSVLQPIASKATSTLSIVGAAGSNDYVNQTGNVSLTGATGGGTLNLVSSGTLTISGTVNTVTYGTVNLTAPNLTVASGTINVTDLTVTAPVININGGTTTVTNATTFQSTGALAINGNGTLALGPTLNLGGTITSGKTTKTTSAITLGNAKTGLGNPLQGVLSGGLTLTDLTINTTGTFTSSLTAQTIATKSGAAAGTITITAGGVVAFGNTSNAPVIITANGTGAGDVVSLTLTGTQAVTLSDTAATKAPAPYELETEGNSTGAVLVSAKGNLTAAAGGVSFGTSTTASVSLTSAKSLAVTGLSLATDLSSVTLSSGGTTPFTVGAGASAINGTSGKVDAPTVSINSGGGIVIASGSGVTATTSSTFSNNTGLLTITGALNSITLAGSLNLSAKTGITLGAAKTGLLNPLQNAISGVAVGGVTGLTITTGGNLTGDLGVLATQSGAAGGNLSVTAGNIVNLVGPLSPIVVTANSTTGNAGTVLLKLTGTQSATLGTATVTKGAPNISVGATGGTEGGTVNVQTAGALTVNTGGVALDGTGNTNTLTLSGGKGLSVTDNTILTGATNLNSLSLISGGSAPFVIGATGKALANGTATGLSAGAVALTDLKGITVDTGITVAATGAKQALTIDTSSLLNNGTISGGGALSTLAFSDPGKNNLGVVATGTGSYATFGLVTFTTNGNVNLGNLFTSATTLNTGLSSIDIYGTAGSTSSTGSVTFASGTPIIDANAITINAASLVSKATTPITFGAGDAITVNVTDKAALTVGTAKGNINVNVAATLSNVDLTSTAGTLTISSTLAGGLNFGSGSLIGSSLAVNQIVTAGTGNLTAFGNGKSGVITSSGAGSLVDSSGTLTVGQTSITLAKTAFNVDADTVVVGAAGALGALNFNNTSSDKTGTTISGGASIAALTYTTTQNPDTTVGSITTTAGGISVTASSGTLTLINATNNAALQTTGGGINLVMSSAAGTTLTIGTGSTLTTSSGSITLENRNTSSGQIAIDANVNISASGTAAGVGQVSIVIGQVPTTGLLPTPKPSPAPTVNANGGANVFYTTTSNPGNTIGTSGANTLNALGRNIVFNVGTNTKAITLAGNDTITADPPAGVANSPLASLNVASPVVGSTPAISAASPSISSSLLPPISPTVSLGQGLSGGSAIAGLSSLNATSSFNANSGLNGTSDFSATSRLDAPSGLSAIASPTETAGKPAVNNIDCDSQTASSSRPSVENTDLPVGSGSKRLSGKVSNTSIKTLDRGPLLISPQTPTVVQTDFGSVAVAAKSLALIIAFDGGVAVYNLHDSRKDAVVLNCGQHNVSLSPGQNAVITSRRVRFFEEINPAQSVAYRRMVANDFGDGIKSFRSEFNVLSMLQSYEPLKQFVNSSEPEKRKVSQAMLKTAAIMMGIGGAQPFEYMVARPVTALNTHSANTHTNQ